MQLVVDRIRVCCSVKKNQMLDLDRQQLQYPFSKYRVPVKIEITSGNEDFTGRGGEGLEYVPEMVRHTQNSLRN
jgi:hypothetical protein